MTDQDTAGEEGKAQGAKAEGLVKPGDTSGAEQARVRAPRAADELKRDADSARPRRGATR